MRRFSPAQIVLSPGFSRRRETPGVQSVAGTDLAGAGVAHGSCRDRRLIQRATVDAPAILTNIRPCPVLACARCRRQRVEPSVRAMTVKVALEIEELHLEIRGGPEQRLVEKFAAYRSDQAFHEWMR